MELAFHRAQGTVQQAGHRGGGEVRVVVQERHVTKRRWKAMHGVEQAIVRGGLGLVDDVHDISRLATNVIDGEVVRDPEDVREGVAR